MHLQMVLFSTLNCMPKVESTELALKSIWAANYTFRYLLKNMLCMFVRKQQLLVTLELTEEFLLCRKIAFLSLKLSWAIHPSFQCSCPSGTSVLWLRIPQLPELSVSWVPAGSCLVFGSRLHSVLFWMEWFGLCEFLGFLQTLFHK